MKKCFSLFFALLLVIGIVGCSNQSETAKVEKNLPMMFLSQSLVKLLTKDGPNRIS